MRNHKVVQNGLALAVCASVLLIACSASHQPATPYYKVRHKYPDALYLMGIGEVMLTDDLAACRRHAEDLALVEVAKQIRVNVAGKVVDIIREQTGQRISEQSSEFAVISEAATEYQFEGIKVAEHGPDRTRCMYYAVAVLDREAAAANLSQKIAGLLASAAEKKRAAAASLDGGATSVALRQLWEAREELLKAIYLQGDRRVILGGLLGEMPGQDSAVSGQPTLGEVNAMLERALKYELPPGPVGDLRIVAEIMARGLMEGAGTSGEQIPLFVEDFKVRSRSVGGAFAHYFSDRLKGVLARHDRCRVFRNPWGTDLCLTLSGDYWKSKRTIEVNATLTQPNGEVVSSAWFPIDSMLVSGIDLDPVDYNEGQEQRIQSVSDNCQSQTLNVELWTDRGRSAVYTEGETLRVYIKADKDCYVYLIDFEPGGNPEKLVPNQYAPGNFIRAGTVYRVTGDLGGSTDIIISQPFGTDVLKVFASTATLDVDRVLSAASGTDKVADIRALAHRDPSAGYAENSVVLTSVAK